MSEGLDATELSLDKTILSKLLSTTNHPGHLALCPASPRRLQDSERGSAQQSERGVIDSDLISGSRASASESLLDRYST